MPRKPKATATATPRRMTTEGGRGKRGHDRRSLGGIRLADCEIAPTCLGGRDDCGCCG
jgi:hypothetical protein